jgi:hypothetical protein
MDVPNAPDFVSLPVAFPSRRFDHGQPYEYRLALGAEDEAVLQLVAGKGWAMTIVAGGQRAIERGLFATLRDALMVIYAEFYGTVTVTSETTTA